MLSLIYCAVIFSPNRAMRGPISVARLFEKSFKLFALARPAAKSTETVIKSTGIVTKSCYCRLCARKDRSTDENK